MWRGYGEIVNIWCDDHGNYLRLEGGRMVAGSEALISREAVGQRFGPEGFGQMDPDAAE